MLSPDENRGYSKKTREYLLKVKKNVLDFIVCEMQSKLCAEGKLFFPAFSQTTVLRFLWV